MLTTVEGIYRNGVIELIQAPPRIGENARVIVTFLEAGETDLISRGISVGEAAELRARMATFAEDWESDEMSIYDDYESAKSRL